MIKVFYIIILFICASCASQTEINESIGADDFGLNQIFTLSAQNVTYLTYVPSGLQAGYWYNTGNIVGGSPSIVMHVGEDWYPWGNSTTNNIPACIQQSCYNQSICQNFSSIPDVNYISTINTPCFLNNGIGLYILIAAPDQNGNFPNPNQQINTIANPSLLPNIYTAHLGALSPDSAGNITLTSVYQCTIDNNSPIGFNCDKEVNISSLAGGKIYMKIMDSYYSDNAGGYAIQFIQGAYQNSFINTVILLLNDKLRATQEYIYTILSEDAIVWLNAILILYLIFTGITFAIGLIPNMSYKDVMMKIFKLVFVITVINNYQWFNTQVLSIYGDFANEVSDILISSIFSNSNNVIDNTLSLPVGTNYLIAYDNIFNAITSTAVSLKILSLFWTFKYILFIPLLYLLIFLVLIIILKSIVLYALAYVVLNILLALFPIFVFFILFRITNDIFENLLKYILNAALLVIMTTASVGIILKFVTTNIFSLLQYAINVDGLTIDCIFFSIPFYIWYPTNLSAVDNILTMGSYFLVFFEVMIAFYFMEYVPKFADALSQLQRAPMMRGFQSLWNNSKNNLKVLIRRSAKFTGASIRASSSLLGSILMSQPVKSTGKLLLNHLPENKILRPIIQSIGNTLSSDKAGLYMKYGRNPLLKLSDNISKITDYPSKLLNRAYDIADKYSANLFSTTINATKSITYNLMGRESPHYQSAAERIASNERNTMLEKAKSTRAQVLKNIKDVTKELSDLENAKLAPANDNVRETLNIKINNARNKLENLQKLKSELNALNYGLNTPLRSEQIEKTYDNTKTQIQNRLQQVNNNIQEHEDYLNNVNAKLASNNFEPGETQASLIEAKKDYTQTIQNLYKKQKEMKKDMEKIEKIWELIISDEDNNY